MIAHCELMGDRVAILDPPPGPQRPAGQGVAGRRAPATTRSTPRCTGRGSRCSTRPPAQNIFVPPSGHMAGIWAPQRRHPRRAQGAGERGGPRRGRARDPDHQERARPAQPGRHQLHPAFPGRGIRVWGARTLSSRPGLALPQRAPALQLPRGVDPQRHPVGGVRAERRRAVGPDPPHDQRVPGQRVAQGRAVRAHARTRRSTSSATARPTRPRASTPARSSARSASRRSSRPSSSIFRLAQFSGGTSLVSE